MYYESYEMELEEMKPEFDPEFDSRFESFTELREYYKGKYAIMYAFFLSAVLFGVSLCLYSVISKDPRSYYGVFAMMLIIASSVSIVSSKGGIIAWTILATSMYWYELPELPEIVKLIETGEAWTAWDTFYLLFIILGVIVTAYRYYTEREEMKERRWLTMCKRLHRSEEHIKEMNFLDVQFPSNKVS